MKVFLTGATGYVGSAVAEALLGTGYEVVGLARSDDAARRLAERGMSPVRGDLKDPGSLLPPAREAEAVIHAGFQWPDPSNTRINRIDVGTVEAMLGALERTGKPFVYTSTCLVMGDTAGRVADEDSQINPPDLYASWRPALERRVLEAASRGVRAIVIRPAWVYGRGGGTLAEMLRGTDDGGVVGKIFRPAPDGSTRFVGTGENRWPWVHVEDLADLYVRALERAPAGALLIASDGPSVRLREVAEAVSRARGAGGRVAAWPLEEARRELGAYADALVVDQQLSAAKARRLLGWEPQAPSLFEELESGSYARMIPEGKPL